MLKPSAHSQLQVQAATPSDISMQRSHRQSHLPDASRAFDGQLHVCNMVQCDMPDMLLDKGALHNGAYRGHDRDTNDGAR